MNCIVLRYINIFYFCWELSNVFFFCILYFISFELKYIDDLLLSFFKVRLYLLKYVDGFVILCLNVRWLLDTDWGVYCLFWKVIFFEIVSSYFFKIWGSVFCMVEISI